jgi:hypothetical protein
VAGSLAKGVCKGLPSCVETEVRLQVGFVAEGLFTHAACERLPSCVRGEERRKSKMKVLSVPSPQEMGQNI